ncbi:MAG: hypothetical protein RMX65_021510 [Nostoc sp. DedQUE01]
MPIDTNDSAIWSGLSDFSHKGKETFAFDLDTARSSWLSELVKPRMCPTSTHRVLNQSSIINEKFMVFYA